MERRSWKTSERWVKLDPMPTYLRPTIGLCLSLLLTGCIVAPPSALELPMPTRVLPNADFDLAAYRWENRILLIFGPAAHDDRFEEQVDLFAAQAEGIIDRDLLIVHVLGDDLGETARSLRERYAVARDAFAVLLIGKDGGLKHRFAAPVTAAEIFGLIDVMPMRMREMQEDGE